VLFRSPVQLLREAVVVGAVALEQLRRRDERELGVMNVAHSTRGRSRLAMIAAARRQGGVAPGSEAVRLRAAAALRQTLARECAPRCQT
jgi:hypothetical protein